jgi:hypothetical protein
MRKLVNEAGGLAGSVSGAHSGEDPSAVGTLVTDSDARYDHAAMGVLVGGWEQPEP